jgi:hypothetical protein
LPPHVQPVQTLPIHQRQSSVEGLLVVPALQCAAAAECAGIPDLHGLWCPGTGGCTAHPTGFALGSVLVVRECRETESVSPTPPRRSRTSHSTTNRESRHSHSRQLRSRPKRGVGRGGSCPMRWRPGGAARLSAAAAARPRSARSRRPGWRRQPASSIHVSKRDALRLPVPAGAAGVRL